MYIYIVLESTFTKFTKQEIHFFLRKETRGAHHVEAHGL
jgi:hypothetical protein